jgi:hypothetical protein
MVNLTVPAPKPESQLAPQASTSKPHMPHDVAIEGKLKMPNERDQSVDMTADAPDPLIEQAAVDMKQGLQDTSNGAELNRAYKKLK